MPQDNSSEQKQGYQGQRHPNEDEIVQFPKIPYMDYFEVEVEEGASSVTLPEEYQDITMQREDMPDIDSCYFRVHRSPEKIIILNSLTKVHPMNYHFYKREKFPQGEIKLGTMAKTPRLEKIFFSGNDDEITLSPIQGPEKTEDEDKE